MGDGGRRTYGGNKRKEREEGGVRKRGKEAEGEEGKGKWKIRKRV